MSKKVIKVDFKNKTKKSTKNKIRESEEEKFDFISDRITECLTNYFLTEDKEELKKLGDLIFKDNKDDR